MSFSVVAMYYLSEKEKEILKRSFGRLEIEDSLRGWSWDSSPVRPYSSKVLLSAWEFSSPCPSYRDVYLRRKLGLRMPPLKSQVYGFFVHKIVQKIFLAARRAIYNGSTNILDDIRKEVNVRELVKNYTQQFSLSDQETEYLVSLGNKIIEYETLRIQARLDDVLATYDNVSEDSLAFLTIPFLIELVVDGRYIGLSKNIRTDSFGLASLIYDIKLGKPNFRHRLQVTAYALALEANFLMPVNYGCIVYVRFQNGKLKVHREIFEIDDKLRSQFLEIRDNLQYMLVHDKDPGPAKNCPKTCMYREYCEGKI
jgi:CRISPR-associated protein Csa1